MIRLVVIGFGYSAAAIVREIGRRLASLHVTARSAEKVERLRAAGLDAHPFDGSALSPAMIAALSGATHLLVSAPPGEAGDPLLVAPEFACLDLPALRCIVYLSTIGVYGDHAGGWVDEDSALRPVSRRSCLRVAAEAAWRDCADARGVDLALFRLSGIYGPGRSAIDNLRAGKARRIVKPGQVFNRIHVSDIAGAVTAAILHLEAPGVFNLTDDEPAPPQDVVAHAAWLLGIDPPPETPFEEADLTPMGRSFYAENKRVSNRRIKAALDYRLRYPTYREGLVACL